MVSAMWRGRMHLEVDELLKLPVFKETTRVVDTHYALVNLDEVSTLLQ